MVIAIKCPLCQAQHHADDSLAGTKAKCNCGQVLTIPHGCLELACLNCGKRHRATQELFGRIAKCPCGATLCVPNPSEQPTPSDSFWDDLQPSTPAFEPEEPAPFTPTMEEESQNYYASLYASAIAQIQSGTSPKCVRDNLIGRGIPHDIASYMVRHIAPQEYVQRADNRVAGRDQMIQGGIAIAVGMLLGSVLSQIGGVPTTSLILIVGGLFRFTTGLISLLTGAR